MKIRFALPMSLLLAACASTPAPPAVPANAADAFHAALRSLCGQAFEGRIVANEPAPTAPDAFEGKALVMHVRDCTPDGIRVAPALELLRTLV